jgi:LPS export ABC transporter protein LptC
MSKLCRLISTRSVSVPLFLLLMLLTACGGSKLDISTKAMDRSLPDETSSEVTITEFDKGSIGYILKAARIDRYYDRRILNAYKVDITAFDSKNGGTTLIKADSTIVDDARNLIFAHGNVQLKSPGGSVATSRMIWDRNADEISAPDKVTLVREGNVLRGRNLRTNLSVYPTEMDSVSAEGVFDKEYLDW